MKSNTNKLDSNTGELSLAERIAELLHKYLRGEWTGDDKVEFSRLVDNPTTEKFLLEFADDKNQVFDYLSWYEKSDPLDAWAKMEKRIAIPLKVVPKPKKTQWMTLMLIAAVVLLVATVASISFYITPDERKEAVSKVENEKPVYDTVATSIGEHTSLTLPDGTRVWLNSESSIKYPETFTGNERVVDVSGEVYLEVAKDPKKKFIAHIIGPTVGGNKWVEVLGTRFEISAYEDEAVSSISLYEGRVTVKSSIRGSIDSVLLRPGQQASIPAQGRLMIEDVKITDTVASWKDGWISFHSADVGTIMRQVGRWYNVEVVYPPKMTDEKYSGKFQRDMSLTQVLTTLKQVGIRLKHEGNKIIVLP